MKTKNIVCAVIAFASLLLSSNILRAEETLSPDRIPPVVIKTIPEAGSTDVDFGIVEVRITFSKPMYTDSCSFFCVSGHENKSLYASKPRFEADDRTFVIKVKLEPNTTYGFAANNTKFRNFKDSQGNSAFPYLIAFKTKAK